MLIVIAPGRVLRGIPNSAKEESTQIITDILYMHSKAQGDEARQLELFRLALLKNHWLAPTTGESEKKREYVESMDEARKTRFVEHRCRVFYSGRWEELIDTITKPERTTARDEPTHQRRKHGLGTLKMFMQWSKRVTSPGPPHY